MMKSPNGFPVIIYIFGIVNSEKCLRFQEDEAPNTDSYAFKILNPSDYSTNSIKSFTLSVWFKIDFFRVSTYLMSYATSDSDSNEMNLRVDNEYISLALTNSMFRVHKSNIFPHKWYHFLATLNELTRQLNVYIDGRHVYKKSTKSRTFYLNGSLVLGQETDKYNGGFVAQQSFSGWITQFNLFSKELPDDELQLLINCSTSGDKPGDIISWKDTTWKLEGSVYEETLNICPRGIVDATFIKDRMTIEESKLICFKFFRTSVFVPKSDEENEILYNATNKHGPDCKSTNHALGYLWLGITDELENGKWTTFEHEPMNYTNFHHDTTKSSIQSCAVMQRLVEPMIWDDIGCSNLHEICPVCTVDLERKLTLRGLCESDNIHAQFTSVTDETGVISFKGFTRYVIELNTDKKLWELNDIWLNLTIAEVFLADQYPIGSHDWKIVEDYALCNMPADKEKTLSLTNCIEHEFNCEDGSCIPEDKRCDLRVDCADTSDEDNCHKLIDPIYDVKSLFPPGVKGNSLKLNLTLFVDKIADVDVRGMKITLDLTVLISWFDTRLQYSNLKETTDLNIIKAELLWVPDVEYVNADFQSIHKSNPTVYITRLSEHLEDNISRASNDLLYDGRENPLKISWKVNAPFDCEMYLYEFPFDHQKCKILFKLKQARAELISWGDLKVIYRGPDLLTEYEVEKVSADLSNDSTGFSIATISIPLSRKYSYYVTTTFLPTVMLVLISHMSLFCKIESRDLRVMLTITTLLVLYSLYQQVSFELPKTSYAKAIDIWCFFCLLVIMTQVIFHILVEVHMSDLYFFRQHTMLNDRNKVDIYKPEDMTDEMKMLKKIAYGQIFYAVICILFTLAYIIMIQFRLYSRT